MITSNIESFRSMRLPRAFLQSRCINSRVEGGGILVEVLVTLLLFTSTSAYLLNSKIRTLVLWETILETQINQTAVNNSSRTAYINDDVDQQWSDIAVFGTPSLLSTPP
ncbi:hypothetical protein [Alteromonas sp. IB21]|uniref:hypothetical protein n=1 Tax=Alteromonas sp. IB21 TaxID=2779369 RepID=UPI001E454C26|nr:hypothetical protein [Alteromonas sp. IB21]